MENVKKKKKICFLKLRLALNDANQSEELEKLRLVLSFVSSMICALNSGPVPTACCEFYLICMLKRLLFSFYLFGCY
jgi:hypothetical protein